jgi:hypothetical protein
VEGCAGPKRRERRRQVKSLAAGLGVRDPDAILTDALFLHEHPGWSWQDLQDTPYEVIDLLRMIGTESAKVASARANKEPLRGVRK